MSEPEPKETTVGFLSRAAGELVDYLVERSLPHRTVVADLGAVRAELRVQAASLADLRAAVLRPEAPDFRESAGAAVTAGDCSSPLVTVTLPEDAWRAVLDAAGAPVDPEAGDGFGPAWELREERRRWAHALLRGVLAVQGVR